MLISSLMNPKFAATVIIPAPFPAIMSLSSSPTYIILSVGEDKRTKKLILSKKGQELEKRLSEIQIKKIRNVLLKFNEMDINGFKKILYEMVDDKNKEKFDEINR